MELGAFTLVRFYPEPARSDRALSLEIYENGRESNPYQLPCTFRDFVKRQGPLTRFAEFEAKLKKTPEHAGSGQGMQRIAARLRYSFCLPPSQDHCDRRQISRQTS